MKKGQTAMEYLMTYGWAILIILIVGGLLVFYGVFSLNIGASKTGFGLVDVTSPWDYKANGSLVLRFENRLGQPVTFTRAWLANPDTSSIDPQDLADFADVFISLGQTSDFITLAPTNPIAGSTGSRYNIKLVVEYTASGQGFNSTGQLAGTRS